MKKIKTVKFELIFKIVTLIIILTFGLTLTSYIVSKESLEENSKLLMVNFARECSNKVDETLRGNLNVVETLAMNSKLSDSSITR